MTTETATVPESTRKAMTDGTNRTVENIKQTANAAATSMREGQARLEGTLEQGVNAARKVVDFQREAFETLAKAGRVYADGLRTISTGIADTAQQQLAETLETYRAIGNVKTVREGLALQAQLARTGASRFLNEGATVAEQSVKLASDVLAPISARVRAAAQKLAA